jgi:hypothetical protein
MPAERARPLALYFVQNMELYGQHITEASVFTYPDGHDELRFNEDLMSDEPTPGAVVRTTVYPKAIVAALKDKLGVPA